MISIGVAQWCLDSNGVDAVYRAERLGLSAIQLDFGDLGEDYSLGNETTRKLYQRAARDTGVSIAGVAVNVLNSYGMNNPAGSHNRRRSWESIQRAVDAAVAMDVALVFLPSFDNGEIFTDQDLKRTAGMLRDACNYAEESNVLVATENTLGVAGNLELISAVDHPNCRVLIDTLNPVLWGHDTSDLVQELWLHMCDQIHVKDGIDGVMGNATLNTGQANFAETADVLRSLGFSGYLILENEYGRETDVSVARDIAVLERLFDKDFVRA